MTEIYNIPIPDHERFARDKKTVEDYQKTIGLGNTQIDQQTRYISTVSQLSAYEVQLGTNRRKSWPTIEEPEGYKSQIYSTPYLVAALGGPDRQRADLQKIETFTQNNRANVSEEGAKIAHAARILEETNEMIERVRALTLRFVQG